MSHSRNARHRWIAASLLGAICLVSSTVGCSRQSAPIAANRVEESSIAPRSPVVTASYEVEAAAAAVAPRAKPIKREFDFGTVEPLQTHHHAFQVRNSGEAPLKLFSPITSCKCLSIESVTEEIPPGGVGEVVVAWKAKAAQDVFVQEASVKTNDPFHKTLKFKVYGQALLLLATDPPELVAARIKPGDTATIGGTIFSQVLDHFDVADVTASLEGLEWTITPASPARLRELRAKSGWNVKVKVPDDLPQGGFAHWLRFKAEPGKLAKPIDADLLSYEIPVRGKVLRRLSVFGQGIDWDGTLDVGIVKPSVGFERTLTVRVQDRDQLLKVTSVEAQPKFVEAHLEPFTGKDSAGLYRLRLRIPPDATPGNYRGDNLGKIRLMFDHPRIDALELRVSFVVPNDKPTRLQQISRLEPVGEFAERSP